MIINAQNKREYMAALEMQVFIKNIEPFAQFIANKLIIGTHITPYFNTPQYAILITQGPHMTHLEQLLEFSIYANGLIRSSPAQLGGGPMSSTRLLGYLQEKWNNTEPILNTHAQNFLNKLDLFFTDDICIDLTEWNQLNDSLKEQILFLDERVHTLLSRQIMDYPRTIETLIYQTPDYSDIIAVLSLLPVSLQSALNAQNKVQRYRASQLLEQDGYIDAAQTLKQIPNNMSSEDVFMCIKDKIDGLIDSQFKKLSHLGRYLNTIQNQYSPHI